MVSPQTLWGAEHAPRKEGLYEQVKTNVVRNSRPSHRSSPVTPRSCTRSLGSDPSLGPTPCRSGSELKEGIYSLRPRGERHPLIPKVVTRVV